MSTRPLECGTCGMDHPSAQDCPPFGKSPRVSPTGATIDPSAIPSIAPSSDRSQTIWRKRITLDLEGAPDAVIAAGAFAVQAAADRVRYRATFSSPDDAAELVLSAEQHAQFGVRLLREARAHFQAVGADRTVARIKLALSSALGAQRHAPNRKPRCASEYTNTDYTYRCRLLADHPGDHVDTRHPLHPSWKD